MVRLAVCALGDLRDVGAKAAALAEALRQGLPVPPAVVGDTQAPARWRGRIATRKCDEPIGAPLSGEALDEVVGLVLDVAAWLGRPCDVEWVWDGSRVWLVQARPVTASSWSPAPGQWT